MRKLLTALVSTTLMTSVAFAQTASFNSSVDTNAPVATPAPQPATPVTSNTVSNAPTPAPTAMTATPGNPLSVVNGVTSGTAPSSAPVFDRVRVATFQDDHSGSNGDDDSEYKTSGDEVSKDISDCSGYIMHVKYMSKADELDTSDFCLAKGEHNTIRISHKYDHSGVEKDKYGWDLYAMSGNKGYVEDTSVLIMGSYSVPVDIASGDQNNKDAMLSLPVIQKLDITKKDWYNLKPVDTHTDYHVLPLHIEVSFEKTDS